MVTKYVNLQVTLALCQGVPVNHQHPEVQNVQVDPKEEHNKSHSKE